MTSSGNSRHTSRIALSLAIAATLTLGACSIPGTARTKDTTYVLDGKTYVLQEFNFKDQHNYTLFEQTSGERSFIAVYEPGSDRVDLEDDAIPAEDGHLKTIMTVVQNGERQGDSRVSTQQALDPLAAMGGDFGE